MSEALAALNAIQAISTRLADRMARVLVDLEFYRCNGARWKAYSIAGIHRHHYPDDVWKRADNEAVETEFARRIS